MSRWMLTALTLILTLGCSRSEEVGAAEDPVILDYHLLGSERLDALVLNQTTQQKGDSSGSFSVGPATGPLETSGLWRVALGGDSRRSLVLAASQSVSFDLELEADSVLRFSMAELSNNSRLTVSLAGEVASTLDPAEQWRDVEINLSELRGDVLLRFENVSDQGLLVVASPRVVPSGEIRDGSVNQPNVLWIIVDTLRADRFSKRTMPRLHDWFYERGSRFDRAYASAPWTLPSHVSMFTGMDALAHGHNYGEALSSDLRSVIQLFRERGYATMAATGGGYLRPGSGLEVGFDRFSSWNGDAGQVEELIQGIDRLSSWLAKNSSQPHLALLHTYEVHRPMSPREPWFSALIANEEDRNFVPDIYIDRPEQIRRRQDFRNYRVSELDTVRELSEQELGVLAALYDSGASFVDDQVGLMLERLEARGLLENTIVLLSSDHGEALGERGLAEHTTLYDFNLAVPLALSVPGFLESPEQIDAPVSLIDLPATLVDLVFGSEWPQGDGRSLVPLLRGQTTEPRAIWSYAGSTNFGLSLLYRDRLKVVVSDSLDGSSRDEVEVFSMGFESEEDRSLEPSEAPNELLELMRSEFRTASGRHLVFENRNSMPMTLEVDSLTLQHVKVVDLPRVVDVTYGLRSIRLAIPPLASFHLRLDGPASVESLEFVLSGSQWRCVLSADDTSDRRWFVDSSNQTCGQEPIKGASTFTLTGIGSETKALQGLEKETLEQLRSLGYL